MGLIRFFSFDPRTTRMRWAAWFAAVLLGLTLCAVAIARAEGVALVLLYGIVGGLFAKLVTESVRRLHDCGQSGRVGLAPALGIGALLVFALLRYLAYGPGILSWSLSGLALLAIAALLLRPGLPRLPGAGRHATGRVGAVVAAGLVVAGLVFGFAVLRWQQDQRQQSEARTDPAFGASNPSGPQPDARGTAVQAAPRASDPLDDENAALSNRIDDLLNTGNTP